MVTGEPVVAAARLRAAAEPGQTLVGALTRKLTESGVGYGRKRLVKAKGLGRIEAACRIEASPPNCYNGLYVGGDPGHWSSNKP